MFPVHAKCVTFEAGWPLEQKKAREKLKLGKVYTIQYMHVGRSGSTLEFYEIEGKWNTVFFDAAPWGTLSFEEACEDAGWCPTPCDDDCEADCHELHQVPRRRDHNPEDHK
jgi:hypothetical protein